MCLFFKTYSCFQIEDSMIKYSKRENKELFFEFFYIGKGGHAMFKRFFEGLTVNIVFVKITWKSKNGQWEI